ncbi:hypothetical protein ACO1PF_07245 [Alkalibacterium sp. f15]|uniref:hypothetical protein n=1 Tax=Alkalibacterium sp. f15 TaxID=3414029 RepID=UPI003BF9111F
MLNESNSIVLKKILYPLFFGLTWGMLTYTLDVYNADFFLILYSIIAVGTFLYSIWNIWHMLEKKVKLKVLTYISFFTVIFHGSTAVINFYFQGIIATVYGIYLLVLFWKMLTKKHSKNVANLA